MFDDDFGDDDFDAAALQASPLIFIISYRQFAFIVETTKVVLYLSTNKPVGCTFKKSSVHIVGVVNAGLENLTFQWNL